MKLNRVRNATTKAFVKAQLAMTAPKQQKGASALEYIVLAAALIVVIGLALSDGGIQTALKDAFTNLFTDAQTPPATP